MDGWYLRSLSQSTKTMKAAIRRAEKLRERRAFLRERSPSVQSDYTSARAHARLPAPGWRERERERWRWREAGSGMAGMLRSKLHFPGRPLGGQLEGAADFGILAFPNVVNLSATGGSFNEASTARDLRYDLLNNPNINVGKKQQQKSSAVTTVATMVGVYSASAPGSLRIDGSEWLPAHLMVGHFSFP